MCKFRNGNRHMSIYVCVHPFSSIENLSNFLNTQSTRLQKILLSKFIDKNSSSEKRTCLCSLRQKGKSNINNGVSYHIMLEKIIINEQINKWLRLNFVRSFVGFQMRIWFRRLQHIKSRLSITDYGIYRFA